MTASDWLIMLPRFATALAWLIVSGVFATLYASLVVTQDAGLDRLPEKFPKATRRILSCESRWDLIRYAVFLVAMACAVAGVATALLSLPQDAKWLGVMVAVVLVLAAVLFTVLLNIVPRAVSENYADVMSIRLLPVASVLARIFLPLAWPMARLEKRLTQWASSGADEESRPSSEDEILAVVNDAENEELEVEERELIKSVFEFGDTVVRESMTQRVDIVGFDGRASLRECAEAMKQSPFSRFPVYKENVDTILGTVHVKDLMRLMIEGQGEQPISGVAKDVTFVQETMPISELLRTLRAEKEQIAIVVDEYGGTEGLITVEDILEELVGDIHDEYDEESFVMKRLPNGTAILDARITVGDANKLLHLNVPDSDEYDSLGGFLYHELGRIPSPGEIVEMEEALITVQSANARQIQTVHISPKPIPEKA
jgi:putative hemolysin